MVFTKIRILTEIMLSLRKNVALRKLNFKQGSYTNFAQTDQKIYELHVYFMYLKFGLEELHKTGNRC